MDDREGTAMSGKKVEKNTECTRKNFVHAALLLLVIAAGLGCQAAPNLIIAAPGIFLSHATGIQHAEVNFYQVGFQTEINAPVSDVWNCVTSNADIPAFFPWIEKLELTGKKTSTLQLGHSILYETTIAGMKESGTAVVVGLEKDRSVMLTMFSHSHGTLDFRMNPVGDSTRVSAVLTTELRNLSMVRPASVVKAKIHKALSESLKQLKLCAEGKGTVEPRVAAAPFITQTCNDEYVPFDVVKGVAIIAAPPEKVWEIFNTLGEYPHLFQKMDPLLVKNQRDILAQVGNAIAYNKKLGPIDIQGKAVVTNVVPGRSVAVSLFSEYKGGAEFNFIPKEAGKTEFSVLYYLQAPCVYKGEPVDRPVILEQMKEEVNEEIEAFKTRCEENVSSNN